MILKMYGWLLICSISVILISCKKDDADDPVIPVVKPNIEFYAVNSNNQLLKYNANAVETPISNIAITGLQTGETFLGIDFRPATGELYGFGTTNRLYIINLSTGAARMVGTAPVPTGVTGTAAGFNFNPTVDRIRLVYSSGENFRLNPETAAIAATDGAVNGAANASVTALAYSGNKAGSAATVLYDIDMVSQKLYRQSPPNNGTLVEIGSLGVTGITGKAGFDISPDGSVALAALSTATQNGLYSVDTTSGKAVALGNFSGPVVTAIAIPTNPVAYAVGANNALLIFDPSAPATIVSKTITGIMPMENIVGIDFRPLNGQLYALGNSSRLYAVNASSGVATAIGSVPLATVLTGTSFGFNFNPTVDRIRVVGNDGQNLRLHPDLGTIAAVDAALNPGTPSVSGVAYTNNFSGATSTTLFDIDFTTDKLYTQNPPNNGTLVETGALGINVESTIGFDIASRSGTAYAILTSGSSTGLYTINLSSGAATKLADFPMPVRGMTVGLGF